MKTFPMPFLISIPFSINREEVFWGLCDETFQERAHVGRGNAVTEGCHRVHGLPPHFSWAQCRQPVGLGKGPSEQANRKNAVLRAASRTTQGGDDWFHTNVHIGSAASQLISGNRYSCHCQTRDESEVGDWFHSLGF